MPFNHHQSQGTLQVLVPTIAATEEEEEETANFWSKKRRKGLLSEPNSVLDKRSSPSPSPPASTLSSSLGSGGPAASSDSAAAEALDVNVGPEKGCLGGGPQLEDWESMLSDASGVVAAAATDTGQDQSFLHWIMGDNGVDGDSNPSSFGLMDPAFVGLEPIGAQPVSLPNPVFLQEAIDEKPLFMNHCQQLPPPQNPSFFLPLPQFTTQFDTHLQNSPSSNNGNSLFLRRNQLQSSPAFSNPTELVDQLFKAAELLEFGNSIGASGILARLNQLLPSQHPVIGKPLIRSATYFKEALLLLLANKNPLNLPLSTPLDVLLKLGTYKAFSEISPIIQFTNFTSIQAMLEELNGYDRIHIVDFDVGVGGHWSSFMQELAHRRGGGTCPSLKITAFTSNSSHHPLELHLTRENLSHFAAELSIPFEFNVLSLDSFDPPAVVSMSVPGEAVAVNFPIGSVISYKSIPTVLRLIQQMNPRIVVSVEHGSDRNDLSFSHHFLHAFQSCTILLDSIDASGANQDIANKIERYLVQPRIENVVLSRYRTAEKMAHWRSLFASAGFMPHQFSNFTETQAECLLKRVQVRGFQVEKRQASLFLCWQKGELVSVSAWQRC